MQIRSLFEQIKNFFLSRAPLVFWYKHYKILYFLCFCVVLGFGGWFWYYSLHRYSWNDEQKKKFLDSYVKETNFRESRFREAVDQLKHAAIDHEKQPVLKRDIFSGKSSQ
ncbi:MAG: hypothetical protein HYV45_02900 [Candidatus Moranbacteria bacterium]|nr:hypothetical protein [Candidatus Moranbacteria bacterium]